MSYNEYSYGICKECGKTAPLKYGLCKECNLNPLKGILGMFK